MRWRSRNEPLDGAFQVELIRLSERGLKAWTAFRRIRGPRRHHRAKGTPLPPGCPILWVPAVAIRLWRRGVPPARHTHQCLGERDASASLRSGLRGAEVGEALADVHEVEGRVDER